MKSIPKNSKLIDIPNWVLILSGGTLFLGGVGFFLYQKYWKKDTDTTTKKYDQPKKEFECKYDDSFPLQHGSCGENVIKHQRWLNKNGASIKEDRAFGDETLAVTKKKLGKSKVLKSDIA